ALLAIAILVFSFLWSFPTRNQSLVSLTERLSFDLQMELMRKLYPRGARVEPVLIGLDEATEDAFEEPLAMWHEHLGEAMRALALAKPAVVGVDIQLPPRSFDRIKPGLDRALLTALLDLKEVSPLVIAHSVDRAGFIVPIHAPFLRMLKDETFAIDKVFEDPDRVARRFTETGVVNTGTFPVFAGEIARKVGRSSGEGLIDYSVGGLMHYIPIQQVIEWKQAGNVDEIKRRFGGKVVLLGTVARTQDRWKLPVGLSDWERGGDGNDETTLNRTQPGVTVHYQVLRNLLGEGLLRPLPGVWPWIICAILLACVFAPSSRRLYVLAFVGAPIAFFALSLVLITVNWYIPALTFILTLWIAVGVGAVADGMETLAEKNLIRRSFAGSVSPAVLHEILAGNLSEGVSAKTAEVCILFSDIRGFTGISESLSPEEVTSLLTRYFDRMVGSVHRFDGTMDKFMGDGMMVLFGAPRNLVNACESAVRCAADMVEHLRELNDEFKAEGLPPLEIGIGINYGKVVVGNIGSTERHNYSAIGDAVNVASRIEGLTKRLGTPILMTEQVRAQLPAGFEMIDCGDQALRGHSSLQIWGVKVVPPAQPSQEERKDR
ncbi:MAG: adenylate/guanylate cyclase domain-containing protein, partial [Usitatibacteraceae bacterium]